METPAIPPKVKPFASTTELLAKLEGRAAMWRRVGTENLERAAAFDEAAERVRAGETSVTVGRTTYEVA